METPVTVHAHTPLEPEPVRTSPVIIVIAAIIVVLAGTATGFVLSRQKPATSSSTSKSASMVNSQTEAGTKDTKTFKDYATGELKAGGINGEGTHQLVRPGGASQTVYLISSLVDLNSETFLGKKVEVYGQTIKAKTAGWLMDVGYIKLVQ